MGHPLFGPEVRLMLQEHNEAGLAEFCDALHPATVAETLADDFNIEETWRVLGQTSIENQAAIFEYFPLERQVEMVEGTGRPQMARLIEEMSADDRADLLRKLSKPVAESLLRLVDEADRRDIAMLARYEEGTAGALMTTDYAWLPANITAGEALERLRLQAPDTETIYYVNVVNEQRKLLGVVSLRDLILKPRHAILRDFMEDQIVTVNVKDDREKVAQEISRYDLIAIPVVDDDGRLVGIVTHDDAIDVMVEEATEDVHRLGGVGALEENYLEANFVTVWQKRVVWLSLLFVTALGTIFVLSGYHKTLGEVVVLTLFIPLCIGTGGNSGSQAATLITRALALGQLTARDWLRVLRHELAMGLALGLSLGAIGFAICFLLPDSILAIGDHPVLWWRLGLVVSQAVLGICLWGTLVGSMLPLLFRTLGLDPAYASSPFVAIFVDVTGIFIYFSIAHLWVL